MLFGSGDQIENDGTGRIGAEFNILFEEDVFLLAERELTTYRESCADLFMVAALGMDAFGYCRQMFQTVSDAATEDGTKWTEAINVHRFRAVTAVLLGREHNCEGKVVGRDRYIPISILLQKGRTYCLASLHCANQSIQRNMKKSENEAKGVAEKIEKIKAFFNILQKNVIDIFESFTSGTQ